MLKHILAGILAVFTVANSSGPIPVESISSLENERGIICTVFSINKPLHYWMTAKHCVDDETAVMIGGVPALTAAEFPDIDVAILASENTAPSMTLASSEPQLGDKVYVLGYATGFPHPTMFRGYVANTFYIPPGGFIHSQLYDMNVIAGQSGAPVLNDHREVIGVYQFRPNGAASGGVRWEELHTITGKYWD